MKMCCVCGAEKRVEEFLQGGKRGTCKACHAGRARADRAARPEQYATLEKARHERDRARRNAASKAQYQTAREARVAYARAYRETNAEQVRARDRARRATEQGKQAVALRNRRYLENNRSKVYTHVARRNAARKAATPPWADRDVMRGMYELAKLFRGVGLRMQVDHVVPLQHPLVCGLHAHTNLSLMLSHENTDKGNRRWPDMPHG